MMLKDDESHLLQMRGLKQKVRSENLTCVQSHLLQMRGLKLRKKRKMNLKSPSHLLQMRGLKLRLIDGHIDVMVSHLLQMRGLKQICHRIKRGSRRVASFTDAWIETLFFVNTQEE